MVDPSATPPTSRRILALARRDRSAALRELGNLSLDQQVALVCEAPLAERAAVLELLPFAEHVIPALPDAELCFIVKAVGLADAGWILEHATGEQVVACVDLDAWSEAAPDPAALDAWMQALAAAGDEALISGTRALDPELVVLHLASRAEVQQKPTDDEGWQPPEGGQTLDGQFYVIARSANDDLATLLEMLRVLFERDYWRYFRLLQGAQWELQSDLEEWAHRWRSGRLEDLGFPPWESAMGIYRYLKPEERAALPSESSPLLAGEWPLPVWLPRLPEAQGGGHSLFRAIARLDEGERRAAFFSFVALANKVAVADRMPLSDAESTPRAIEKAARLASAGLEHVAEENALSPEEVLRRASIQRLFSVGANLDPASARP